MNITRRIFRGGAFGGIHLRACGGLACTFLLAFAGAWAGRPQSPGQNGIPGQGQGMGGTRGGSSRPDFSPLSSNVEMDPMMAERRLLALNIQRQKQMVSDSNKLLKLAKELSDEVAASKAGSLNPDQLRKLAEIEKLARNVKQRMVDGVGQPADPMGMPPVVFPNQ